jgi:hypothetical protein
VEDSKRTAALPEWKRAVMEKRAEDPKR